MRHPPVTLRAVGITARQFAQLQDRVAGRRREATPAFVAPEAAPRRGHSLILGVDPSLRGTGYGVLRTGKPHPVAVAQGTIHCPAGWERSRCLAHIARTLRDLLREQHPTVCVMEGLFYAQNLQTAIIMGEARGAALATVAEAGLEIYEIAPRKVKQAVVGYGAAQKLAVAKMVQRVLALAELPAPDAADALALALAFAQEQGGCSLKPPRRV
jgi:crossover junction endodeoxyribonuclease RuvC